MYGKYLSADAMIIDDMRNSNMHGEAEKADFCETTSERWCFVSDKVMGGISEGTFETVIDGKDAHYNMKGVVSTENNGGFLQFRTKINNHPKDKLFDGIRIQVRGNNEKYAVHIRTKYLFLPWQYYETTFTAETVNSLGGIVTEPVEITFQTTITNLCGFDWQFWDAPLFADIY